MENLTHLHKRKQLNKGFWKVTRYPNGDFTIGKNQPIKRDDGFKPLEGIGSHKTFYGATKVSVPARQLERDPNPETLEKISIAYEKAGNQDLADRFGEIYAQELLSGRHDSGNHENLVIDGDDLAVPFLGLSDAINSHKCGRKKGQKSAKRGSKGITANGKRMVKNSCYLLERDHGRHLLSLFTATLPAFASPYELMFICANWSELVRQLIQELRRILRRGGYCEDMVYITEIQEDRYANRGEVAPHLHLVMVGKKHRYQKHYAVEKSEARSLWERLLSNFLGRPVTAAAATRLERPKKSLQGELGSYLSKGGKMITKIIQDGKGDQLPSSYWGASQNLKNQIKSETKVMTGRDAQQFVDNLNDLHEAGLVYFKPIFWTIPDTNIQVTIGFCGWIRDIEVVSQFFAA
jgi:hypothetical protein